MKNQAPTSKFESIQALRAIAALYVVLFHVRVPLQLWSPEASQLWLNFQLRGYMGVDLFFVISGFIMAWVCVLARDAAENPIVFAVKRAFRVVPPYWIATVLWLYIMGRDASSESLWRSLFFRPQVVDEAPFYGYATLIVGWTLNFEVFFYALFGAALLFGKRFSLPLAVLAILGLVVGVPLSMGSSGAMYVDRVVDLARPYFRMATNPMMLEFAIGICTAVIYSKMRGRTPQALAGAILAIGAAAFAWRMATYGGGHGGHHPLKLGIPAAALLLGAVLAEDAKLIRIPKTAVWMGQISFAIYLVHPIIITWVISRLMPTPAGPGALFGQLIFMIGFVLMASHYWYRFIEEPSQRVGLWLAKGWRQITTAALRAAWPSRLSGQSSTPRIL